MESSEKLIVVSPLEPMEVGAEFEHIPPHVTLFPPFELGEVEWATFDDEMREIVIEDWATGVTIGGEAVLFGPKNNTEATRLNLPGDSFPFLKLFPVHAALYRFCKMRQLNFDPTHTGLNYHPHITDSSGRHIQTGEEVELSSLAVISKRPDRVSKLVKAVYEKELLG